METDVDPEFLERLDVLLDRVHFLPPHLTDEDYVVDLETQLRDHYDVDEWFQEQEEEYRRNNPPETEDYERYLEIIQDREPEEDEDFYDFIQRGGEDPEDLGEPPSTYFDPPSSYIIRERQNHVPERLNVTDRRFLVTFQRTFRSNRFGLTGNAYTVAPQPTRRRSTDRLHGVILLMNDLRQIIHDNMNDNDYVQLVFHHPELEDPFVMPVIRVSLFDPDVAVDKFESIMTSKTGLDIQDGGLTIWMYHIEPPRGGGRLVDTFGMTTEKVVKMKKGFITIPKAVDPYCLPIAMYVGMKRLEGYKKPCNLVQKRSLPKLMRWAEEITKWAGFDSGKPLPVTAIDALKKHSDFMGYEFAVFENQNSWNRLFCSNIKAENHVNLLLNENHYDVITSLPAFCERTKGIYCHRCNRWFPNNVKRHKCDAGHCYQCKGFCYNEPRNTSHKTIHCKDCGRSFFDQNCFDCHKKSFAAFDNNKPVCGRIFRCDICHCDLRKKKNGTEVNNGDGKVHVCFKSFCTQCKCTVDKSNHECFLRKISKQELDKKQQKRGIFLFFDIETRYEKDGTMTCILIICQDEL